MLTLSIKICLTIIVSKCWPEAGEAGQDPEAGEAGQEPEAGEAGQEPEAGEAKKHNKVKKMYWQGKDNLVS